MMGFVAVAVAMAVPALTLTLGGGVVGRTLGVTGFRFGCAHRYISFRRDK